jgi:hypothetical protein
VLCFAVLWHIMLLLQHKQGAVKVAVAAAAKMQ